MMINSDIAWFLLGIAAGIVITVSILAFFLARWNWE